MPHCKWKCNFCVVGKRWNYQLHNWMQQTSSKKHKTWHESLGIVRNIKIWPYYQMVYDKLESFLENEMHESLGVFQIQTDHLMPVFWLEQTWNKKYRSSDSNRPGTKNTGLLTWTDLEQKISVFWLEQTWNKKCRSSDLNRPGTKKCRSSDLNRPGTKNVGLLTWTDLEQKMSVFWLE